MHRVAPFELISQTGEAVTERDLDGRIHVASFFFTQCPNICPPLVQQLKRVQAATAGSADVRIVSYSVTPSYDTPAVLRRFGEQREIDPRRWLLVTGAAFEIVRLARESYFADDRRFGDIPPGQLLLHTEKVLLVDHERRLRGVYNGTLPFDIDRLIDDIDRLRRSRGSRPEAVVSKIGTPPALAHNLRYNTILHEQAVVFTEAGGSGARVPCADWSRCRRSVSIPSTVPPARIITRTEVTSWA